MIFKNRIFKLEYFYLNIEKDLTDQYIIRFILIIIYIIVIDLILIEIIFICFIKPT
jgi:hypothetical protein